MLKELKKKYYSYISETKAGIVGFFVMIFIFTIFYAALQSSESAYDLEIYTTLMWLGIAGVILAAIITIVMGIKSFAYNKQIKNIESMIHGQLDWFIFREVKISNPEEVFDENIIKEINKTYAIKTSTTDGIALVAVSSERGKVAEMYESQSKVVIEEVIRNSTYKSKPRPVL
ncbi:MAG: hypothetical protein IJN50_02500 [Clostridia bacterium]|nr:hypothetical protein [Clostridia bacterium]